VLLVWVSFGVTSDARGDEAGTAVAERTYAAWCSHCHDPGSGHPGTQRLEWSFGKDKSVLRDRADLNADYIKQVVRNGRLEMPSFRSTEISAAELDALAAYLAPSE
jgi:mono/diheme cytochrome c family protein